MFVGKSSQLGKHDFGSLHNLTWTCYHNEEHNVATLAKTNKIYISFRFRTAGKENHRTYSAAFVNTTLLGEAIELDTAAKNCSIDRFH